MKIECVKITYKSSTFSTEKRTLEIVDETIRALTDSNDPAVYLFANKQLEELRRFDHLIVDRKQKNVHKGLAEYFLKQATDKIQLLATTYSTAKKMFSGLRPLFKKTEAYKGNNIFFMGVDQEVFQAVLRDAAMKPVEEFRPTLQEDRTCIIEAKHEQDFGEREYGLLTYLERRYRAKPERTNAVKKHYVGNSRAVRITRMMILAAADTDVPVLIIGDTGTGKEVVARQIHEQSKRKNELFQPVNCGSIPRELLELELFGCEADTLQKGYPLKKGLWEKAGHGTLFLDEIGDMSLDHQVRILRALGEGTIRRVGGTKDIKVHARVLAATNRNLFSMVQAKTFREDLYYRLRGFFIRTPTLRNHPEDIPAIAQHLWQKITGKPQARLSAEILAGLGRYSWPGNVRELKMVLTNLYALFQSDNPSPANLQEIFHLEGQVNVTTDCTQEVSLDEMQIQRAHCLRHLNRTYEVFHACRHKLRAQMDDEAEPGISTASLRDSLNFLHHEVEQLCAQPLYFHKNSVFSAVYDFKGKIVYLRSLLQKDQQDAIAYITSDMIGAIDKILSLVFQEIEVVMAEG